MRILIRHLGLLSVAISISLSSQERPLSLADVRDVAGIFTNPAFPAKCGRQGDFYVRLFNGSSNMPATRISPDGSSAKTFGLDGTKYFGHAHIWDFTPDEGRGVYQLIWYGAKDQRGYRLLGFDSDGKLTSDNPIGTPFDPMQIASLGNGNLVVAGRKSNAEGGHKGEPAIGIINRRGQLVTMLRLEHDVLPPKKQKLGAKRDHAKDNSFEREDKADEEYNYSIDLSIAQSADDGSVYVLRQSPVGPLFAVTEAGTVREIALPNRENGTINIAMVARGRLLLHYVQRTDDYRLSDSGVYASYDLLTMEKIVEYKVEQGPLSSNSMPVCYDSDQLTFLKIAPKGHLSILTAKLK